MKISNPLFFKARNDRKLEAMLVIRRPENNEDGLLCIRSYFRLCIHRREKYSNEKHDPFLEVDTDIRLDNFSSSYMISKRIISNILFHCVIYGEGSHIRTFLLAIRKESDVSFRLVAFNGSNFWNEHQAVSHQLYGVIDGREYFLAFYVGADGATSPVR